LRAGACQSTRDAPAPRGGKVDDLVSVRLVIHAFLLLGQHLPRIIERHDADKFAFPSTDNPADRP
jgi:hypothetical protein